jgi:hypothetical protein
MRAKEFVTETLSPQRIHDLADKLGIAWDNDPEFMALTKRVTGKSHLDDLDQKQLATLYKHLSSRGNLDEETKLYYHGSMEHLPVGTILRPNPDYEKEWQSTDFYNALEFHRPPGMMAHKDSVFMCDNPDDVDAAGGGTEWLFTVKPLGPIQRHDLNWSSEISMLWDEDHDFDSAEVEQAADNYWAGIPHPNEQVWEYLTPSAEIIAAEPY